MGGGVCGTVVSGEEIPGLVREAGGLWDVGVGGGKGGS